MAQTCNRPGCSGQIVDGVCEDCGRAPIGGPSLVAGKSQWRDYGASAPAAGVAQYRRETSPAPYRFGANRSGLCACQRPFGRIQCIQYILGIGNRWLLAYRGGAVEGSRRGSTTHGSRSTRRTLGAGMVQLEPLPTIDPLLVIMADPSVPDNKRYCPNCNAKLNHPKGFCPMCGTEYSFVPSLKAGDVVAGQYEVKGAMAFGGLGWIYLAWDTALSRWVVMKGLLNSKDAASAAAAMAERQFLAAVKHPNIVGVYNFVNQGTEGYIVMEYVGGKTLKALRKERGPLPTCRKPSPTSTAFWARSGIWSAWAWSTATSSPTTS